MLDRRDLLDDAGASALSGGVPAGHPVRRVRGGPDGLARDDDQPGIERLVVDGDRVEPLADLERDGRRVLVDRHPVRAGRQLDPRPSQDERPVGVVLELVLGVDPSPDGDVARRSAGQRRAPRRR